MVFFLRYKEKKEEVAETEVDPERDQRMLPPEVSCFLGYSLWGYNVICDVPGLRCTPYNGPQFKSFQESWVRPFNFEMGKTKGSLPKLHLNPYSWSNVIYDLFRMFIFQ
ncbi:hypothetical protein ACSBR1_008533 [Camellia fascicularis]